MPELWRMFGMRFFFYSRDHETIHVNVKSAEGLAKFNVTEEGVEIVTNAGMRAKDLNLALMEILKRKDFVISEWESRFGK